METYVGKLSLSAPLLVFEKGCSKGFQKDTGQEDLGSGVLESEE